MNVLSVEWTQISFPYTKIVYLHLFNLLKPIGYVMHRQVQHWTIVISAHIVFMCFVFIW
jgi:hypothetical protein